MGSVDVSVSSPAEENAWEEPQHQDVFHSALFEAAFFLLCDCDFALGGFLYLSGAGGVYSGEKVAQGNLFALYT